MFCEILKDFGGVDWMVSGDLTVTCYCLVLYFCVGFCSDPTSSLVACDAFRKNRLCCFSFGFLDICSFLILIDFGVVQN